MECSDDEQFEQQTAKKGVAQPDVQNKNKKKKKQQVNIYEKEAPPTEPSTANPDDDSDDDPIFGKKKKKNVQTGAQKQKRGGNRPKKNKDEEETLEETKEETAVIEEQTKTEETVVEQVKKISYPLEMVYCGKCGLPPEYCEFAGKQFDIDECKKWLQQTHASLFSLTYPVVESGEAAEGEESKEQPKKKKKSVKIVAERRIRVIKLKRGGKKVICNILGFELYGCNLAEVAKMLGKKFGSGAASVQVEYKEINQEGVQIQGDIQERFEEFITKDLAKYEIPWSSVTFEDGGNFKTK